MFSRRSFLGAIAAAFGLSTGKAMAGSCDCESISGDHLDGVRVQVTSGAAVYWAGVAQWNPKTKAYEIPAYEQEVIVDVVGDGGMIECRTQKFACYTCVPELPAAFVDCPAGSG